MDSDVYDRRVRRYTLLARKHLPKWAHDAFTPSFRDALGSLYWARLHARHPHLTYFFQKPDEARVARAQAHLKRCVATVERIRRLCTYSVDMERTWETITTTTITNPAIVYRHPAAIVFEIVALISEIVDKFDTLPKVAPAVRSKSLLAIAGATDDLRLQLKDDPDARRAAFDILNEYLWARGLEKRPHHSLASSAFAERATFLDLLEYFQNRMIELASERPAIAHPGRSDQGLQPFLIRELSRVMRMTYGKPLDGVVALLVSAIMDVTDPLNRDDVRPYTKGAGKILAQE